MRITLTAVLILSAISFSFAQVPGVKWTNYYSSIFGNSGVGQSIFDAKKMPDGGFILVGNDSAYSYNKESYLKKNVGSRPFMLRVDKDGNSLWHLNFNGVDPYNASFTSVDVTSTGDIIVTGYGRNYPQPVKYFIAKYTSDGIPIWSKIYGGATGISKAYSIVQTSDAGCIVAGVTTSNDGDVVGNHNAGTNDVWLLKLDDNGNIQWKKCFGGSADDSAYSVIPTPDDGFVVVGSSTSTDGDLTANNGVSDAWIFKINNSGNLVWQKNIGGSGYENFQSVVFNSDTSYTITGFTSSSSITNNGNYGLRDLWLIKMKDGSGDIQWSKNFGGSGDEQGLSVQKTIGNGYLIAGYTESTDGDVSGNNGLSDAWLLKLDANANLQWQKCVGTNKNDVGMAAIYLSETDFAIAGFAEPATPTGQYNFIDLFLSRLGNTNTIKGLVFYDANSNGIKDANETGFNEAVVTTSSNLGFQRSVISQNGLFNINVDIGSYNTSVHINNAYYNVFPSATSSNFVSYFNTDSISFAVQPLPAKRDLIINMIPTNTARPAFIGSYRIFYKNVGTDIVSDGEIVLAFNSLKIAFGSSSPSASYTNYGDTVKWYFSNFKPFDSASISINMLIGAPPYVNNGDTIKLIAFVNPVAGDLTPSNDTAILKQRLVGSYDPNDKTENNGGIIGSDYIAQGKYLNYTIRFQNTGTDTAFNVIVRDTLDSKLDWSTFEMVAASHPYAVIITNQNKIEWTFSNINLADSNINEPLSHGYVSYRIKPKSTTAVGDIINNLASIYFDYNLPVATNNALTLVQDNFTSLPIQLINFTGQLSNNTVQLNWKADQGRNFEKFEIERSLDGKIYTRIETIPFNNLIHDYHLLDNISVLQSKLIFYRLKMIDADSKFSYSKIIVFRTNPVQNNFTIYPNPARTEIFVSLLADKKQNLRIKVLDASGRIVSEHQKEVQKGTNVFPVNTFGLKAGTYILQMVLDGETKASKFAIIN
jgi:hypothetical protein